MTRVAFITQWFAPEPTIVPDAIAVALRSAGADVEVLTGVPNYPSGVVHEGYNARTTAKESLNGLPVRRTPLYPSHDRSAVKRIANYVSWSLSSTIFGLGVLRRAQVSVVYGSPITAALPALVARTIFRRPFILVVQDVWPDSVFATGFLTRGLAARLAFGGLTWFTNLVYRTAHKVVVISPGMRDLLIQRGVPSSKLDVIYNWVPDAAPPDLAERQNLRTRWGLDEEDFLLMYAGNHGAAQALSPVVEAVGSASVGGRCHLVMIGEGVEKEQLRNLASDVASGLVHFEPQQPPWQMRTLMGAADAQLVSLADDPLFTVTVPSKLQAILAAGSPVVAVASGDVARIITAADAGFSARPGDVDEIAGALVAMAEAGHEKRKAMGARGAAYYDDEMSERVGTTKWAAVLQEVVGTDE